MNNIDNPRVATLHERLADNIEETEFHRYIQEGSEYMPTELVSRYVERIEVRSGQLEDEVDDLRNQVKWLEKQLEDLNDKISRNSLRDLPSAEIERLRQGLVSAIERAVSEMKED